MQTLLEKNIQRAALHGTYETYLALYKQWEALQEQPIPPEKIEQLLYLTTVYYPGGGWSSGSVLTGILNLKDLPPESSAEKSKILVHMLDKLQEANIEPPIGIMRHEMPNPLLWDARGSLREQQATSINHDRSTNIFEWAVTNNAPNVLNHPLVQKQIVLLNIADYAQMRDAANVKRIFDKNKKMHGLSLKTIIGEAIFSEPSFNTNPKINDAFFADLIKNKYCGPDVIFRLKSLLNNMEPLDITFQNAPKIRETELFTLCKAIESLPQNPAQQSTVLSLIDEYFKKIDKEPFASDLILFALTTWEQSQHMPPFTMLTPENKQAQEAILMKLINYGGNLPAPCIVMNIATNQSLMYVINNKMLDVMKSKGALKTFSGLHFFDQKHYLRHVFQSIDENSPQILNLLCKEAKLAKHVIANPPFPTGGNFTPEDLVQELSKPIPADKPEEFTHRVKMIATLLVYDLVERDDIVPGSYLLNQTHPETGERYDLYSFIQETPILYQGWTRLKDQELIDLYKITKALLQKEDVTAEELKEIEKETSLQHGEHTYSLVEIKDWMRQNDFLRERVLSWVNPSQRSQHEREKDIRKVTRVYTRIQEEREKLASTSQGEQPSQSSASENPSASIKKRNK